MKKILRRFIIAGLLLLNIFCIALYATFYSPKAYSLQEFKKVNVSQHQKPSSFASSKKTKKPKLIDSLSDIEKSANGQELRINSGQNSYIYASLKSQSRKLRVWGYNYNTITPNKFPFRFANFILVSGPYETVKKEYEENKCESVSNQVADYAWLIPENLKVKEDLSQIVEQKQNKGGVVAGCANVETQELVPLEVHYKGKTITKNLPKPQTVGHFSHTLYLVKSFAPTTCEYLEEKSEKKNAKIDIWSSSDLEIQAKTNEGKWFNSIKNKCNTTEILAAFKENPPHDTPWGKNYEILCLALGDRLDLAEKEMSKLTKKYSYAAATHLYQKAHQIADLGDEVAAGRIIELVLKYQPNNHVARQHAGMRHYLLGDFNRAKTLLEKFAKDYPKKDKWLKNAQEVLSAINAEKKLPNEQVKKFLNH